MERHYREVVTVQVKILSQADVTRYINVIESEN